MCVIYLSFAQHIEHPLILLANRDEFYERPSAPASYWEDFPEIFAGRDLKGGGTWLGVTKSGRFSAVTNYRDPAARAGTRSRGHLVSDFLKSHQSPEEYLAHVERRRDEYSGFNLLVGEISKRQEVLYYSNRGPGICRLSAGTYGLSNHLLDTPWPKVLKGRSQLKDLIDAGETSDSALFSILADDSLAEDQDLPSTGVPFEIEKAISAIFIRIPGYGTRCSTILRFNRSLNWTLIERVFV